MAELTFQAAHASALIRPSFSVQGPMNEFIETSLQACPIVMARAELGPGKRAYVVLPESTEKDAAIALFADCYVPNRPKQSKFGWGADEIIRSNGAIVQIPLQWKRTEDGHELPFAAEMISLKTFIERHITSKAALINLERAMDELQEAAELDDDFIQNLNLFWHNRDSSVTFMGTHRYVH